jgi:predicted Zn-dependent protease
LNAFVATYQGTSEDVGRVGVRAAHISHDSNVFVLAGLAPTEQFDRAEPVFTRSLRSFRPLKPGEAEDIRPNRIDFYTTRDGDTWQSIAERQGRGVVMAATLAIMNGRAVNEQPRPGERIKIVVAG